MIFPDWGTAPDTAPEETLPLFREWAEAGHFVPGLTLLRPETP